MKRILLLTAGMAVAGAASAQWGDSIDDPVKIFPSGTSSYATEVKASPDGSVWAMIYHPNTRNASSEEDIQNVVYEYIIQHFDKDGKPQFEGKGMVLSDYSNISYTVVNDYLWVDRDGNAIVSVADCRNSASSERSYTAYKISPEGELLWGEDGVPISNASMPANMAACMRMVQLEDGSYVFAWMEMREDSQKVVLQRFDKDGNALWNVAETALDGEVTSYPYLVNSGDNTFILVYTRSSSQIIYARKMDFDASPVWAKDARIYRGGWGSTPIHTLISVSASGNGGVIVGWTDDRNATNLETAYMSYVTADGELGFAGQSDEADAKLTYDEWRCFNMQVAPASDGSGFYAIWRRTDANQNYQGIMIQKVSLEGELLWGDNPPELYPTSRTSLAYLTLQPTDDGGACGFFQEYTSYYDQHGIAGRVDGNGEYVWPDHLIDVTRPGRQSSALKSQPYGSNAWLLNWSDGGSSAEDKDEAAYMMEIFNYDGSFGLKDSGVEKVTVTGSELAFDGSAITGPLADGSMVEIYDMAGIKVASVAAEAGRAGVDLPTGIYFAKTAEGMTLKFNVK